MFLLSFRFEINLKKSNLYGVGLTFEEVEHFSLIIGCKDDKLPFTYLGLSVG